MATTDTTRTGVLYEDEHLTVIDTRALEWTPTALPGVSRKVLSSDLDGEPNVFIFHMAPGFTTPHVPHRHYHATVEEFGFCLAGELPHREYRNADMQLGTDVGRRPGYTMHRLPGSIHGMESAEDVSRLGYMSLMIRTGTGNWINEPNEHEETFAVPFEDGWKPGPMPAPEPSDPARGILLEWDDLTFVDSVAMPWEETETPGRLTKSIAWDRDGNALLRLQYAKPGLTLPQVPRRHYHANDQHDYVVWGEFPTAEYVGRPELERLLLRQGYYVRRRAGHVHGLVDDNTSPSGVCTLEWWTEPGTAKVVPGSGGTSDADAR